MAIDLHGWRNTRGLTQVEAAEMLGVSQTYLSLLETGSRPLTKDLRSRLQALGNSREPQASQTERSFRPQLSALGYPGFRHVGASRRRATPGSLLLQALRQPDLDARVCEALPWVARQYAADVDWEWLVRHAKLHDFQNRLGFLLELARTGTEPMARAKSELEAARLLAEATFCWDSMPEAPGGGCARTARRRRHTGMLWRDCAPRIWSMPNERPAATWFSFLSDLDAQLREDVDVHCMGGSVVSQYYDCARETADLDVLGVVPVQATNQIEALAGKGSPLYRKYRVYLESAGVTSYPDSYESRLIHIFPFWRRLKLWHSKPTTWH